MSNLIVLNHHSLPFSSNEDADCGLLVFFDVLRSCRKYGLKILLVDDDQDSSLMSLELAEDYFVRTWYSFAKKNPELIDWCRFVKSIETKQPIFETIDPETIGGVEVGLKGEPEGRSVLLAAFQFDTFLASFSTLEVWMEPYIDVWVFDLDRKPEESEFHLLNLSNKYSLAHHQEELARRRNELIKSANDIWFQRKELFPNLSLLSNQIGTSLQNWSARQDILKKAQEALNILEVFCSKWKCGEYDTYRHAYLRELGLAAEVSNESRSVSNDPKKRKERLFWLDDGRNVYCESHVKLPDGYRMHFYPDQSDRIIYVAYLGPHLTI